MVVVPSIGARLCIAAGLHRDVHGVDRGSTGVPVCEGVPREQAPQSSFVHAAPTERGVEATPAAAPMEGRQAQVYWRGYGARGEDGVGEFEEGIGASIEAPVERVPEGAQRFGQGRKMARSV
jgi:hypothetical protein